MPLRPRARITASVVAVGAIAALAGVGATTATGSQDLDPNVVTATAVATAYPVTVTETATVTVPGPTETVTVPGSTVTVTAPPTTPTTTTPSSPPPTPTIPGTPTSPPTSPVAEYGGTIGWRLQRTVDLTTEPAGTTYTTGVRSTDQSSNRKANATYGPAGLTVTAERSGGRIYSADVMMRGVQLHIPYAIEADVTMTGTGPGMGHAFWARGLTGAGELDFLEYFGAYAGRGATARPYESKVTVIKTGGQPYNQGSATFPIQPRTGSDAGSTGYDGPRRYRAEVTAAGLSEWVDGRLAGTITKAAFEAANGAGSYAQFAAGAGFYPRLTLQVNNGTTAQVWGTAPASWQRSTITLGALRVYAPTS